MYPPGSEHLFILYFAIYKIGAHIVFETINAANALDCRDSQQFLKLYIRSYYTRRHFHDTPKEIQHNEHKLCTVYCIY